MASVAPTAFAALSHAIPVGEVLSGIFGSVSLTAWICLLLPQLIANFKAQSADGLSMGFLLIWLLGDATNLAGALFTHLAPTAIALAFYFCIADVVLIVQCVYYNTKNARRAARRAEQHHNHDQTEDAPATEAASPAAQEEGDDEQPPGESEPLLASQRRSSSNGDAAGLPGSHRRRSTHHESNLEPLRKIVTGEDDTPDNSPWFHNALSLLAVWIVGAVGWFVSFKAGAWESDPGVSDPEDPADQDIVTNIGMVLGYFSAVCYLFARIPQIIKNWREKSCEGLALLFFLLSLTGNLAYGASLIAYSQEKAYLVRAFPWLLGSLGTIVEDSIIFVQFHLYAPKKDHKPPSAV